jgi:hypothetical protein
MKTLKQYLSEMYKSPPKFKAFMKKAGYKEYSHGPQEVGYIKKTPPGLQLPDVHAEIKKSFPKARLDKKFNTVFGEHVWSYEFTPAPYNETRINVSHDKKLSYVKKIYISNRQAI